MFLQLCLAHTGTLQLISCQHLKFRWLHIKIPDFWCFLKIQKIWQYQFLYQQSAGSKQGLPHSPAWLPPFVQNMSFPHPHKAHFTYYLPGPWRYYCSLSLFTKSWEVENGWMGVRGVVTEGQYPPVESEFPERLRCSHEKAYLEDSRKLSSSFPPPPSPKENSPFVKLKTSSSIFP